MSANYEIGYGKPPKKNQFKPGYSGNKQGRPKGHKNMMSIVRKCAREKILAKQGDKTIKIDKREALFRAHLNEGIKGNEKSARIALKLILESDKQELEQMQKISLLNQNDNEILNTFLKQLRLGEVKNDTDE